jgi:hypothetical protein
MASGQWRDGGCEILDLERLKLLAPWFNPFDDA